MHKILIIEDDIKISNLLKAYLENNDFLTSVVYTGSETRKIINSPKFNEISAVILDLMLPDIEGEILLQEIKEKGDIPVLILSAKSQIDDKLTGLSLGADDYVTKPFNPKEIVLRVRNLLKRYGKIDKGIVKTFYNGRIVINEKAYEILIDNKKVNLTPTEFRILALLIKKNGEIVTREEIIKKVLGYDYEGYDRTVDAHIKNIRNKIKEIDYSLNCIQTVYGVGYMFKYKQDV